LKGGVVMDILWSEFEKKGDIFSYLKYKTDIVDNKNTEVSDINGSGKNIGNSIKNL